MRRAPFIVAASVAVLLVSAFVLRSLRLSANLRAVESADATDRVVAAGALAELGPGHPDVLDALRRAYEKHEDAELAMAISAVTDDPAESLTLALDWLARSLDRLRVVTPEGDFACSRADPPRIVVRPGDAVTFLTGFELPQTERLSYSFAVDVTLGQEPRSFVRGAAGYGEADPPSFVWRGTSVVSTGWNRAPPREAPLWLTIVPLADHRGRGPEIELEPEDEVRLRACVAVFVVQERAPVDDE